MDGGSSMAGGSSMPGMAGVEPATFAQVDVDLAASRLVDLLVEERAGLLVGYDAAGGYGHP